MQGDWNMAGANYFKLPCELFWGGLPMAECQLDFHHFRGKSNQATNQDGKVLGPLALSTFSSQVLSKTSVLIGSILYRFAYAFTRESRVYLALYKKVHRLLISRALPFVYSQLILTGGGDGGEGKLPSRPVRSWK